MKRSREMKIIIFLVSIFTALLLFQSSAYAVKMNIDPPRVEMSVLPGGEEGGYVTVLNYDEDEAIHVKAYVNDLVYLPDGSNDFLPKGSTPWTISDWIKIGPTEFDIAPGQEAKVRYVVNIPKGIEGGRYGVVFFEISPPLADLNRSSATVNIRLGSIFLVTVRGTEEYNVQLQDISVGNQAEDGSFEIYCTVNNKGNVLARPTGPLKIIDASQAEVATLKLNAQKSGVLPGTGRRFSVKYDKDKLAPGEYFIQVILDYGGEDYLGGQIGFTVE